MNFLKRFSKPAIIALFSFSFIFCCIKNPPQLKDEQAIQLAEIRQNAYQMLKEECLEQWNSDVFGKETDFDAIVSKYSEKLKLKNVSLIDQIAKTSTDFKEKKALQYLKLFLLSYYIYQKQTKIYDDIASFQINSYIEFEGEKIPYRQIGKRLADEPERAKRLAIYRAKIPLIIKERKYLQKKLDVSHKLARELGYKDYVRFMEEQYQIDFENLKKQAEEFLDATADLFARLFVEFAPKTAGVQFFEFRRFDAPRLFKYEKFNVYFPASQMVPIMERQLAGWGIDLQSQKNLILNMEDLETKEPRPACYPIDPPYDVRLSVKPYGGLDDYLSLFHEMGHAQHFIHTNTNFFEFKYLGNSTVTETFAFLFENLFSHPEWLKNYTFCPDEQIPELVRYMVFSRLYSLRSYCATFLFELHLHSGDPDPERTFAKIIEPALMYKFYEDDSVSYLHWDEDFYSTSYLQAWFLEAQLKRLFEEKFGDFWFKDKACGNFLKELWRFGQEFTGEELAQYTGLSQISIHPLVEELHSLVNHTGR